MPLGAYLTSARTARLTLEKRRNYVRNTHVFHRKKKKYNEAEQNSHGQADNERSFPGSGA